MARQANPRNHAALTTYVPPRLLFVIAAAWLIPAVLDGAAGYIRQSVDSQPGVNWRAVVFQGAKWLALTALTPITYYMAKRYPIRRADWMRTVASHLVGVLALCIGWATMGLLIEHGLFAAAHPSGTSFGSEYGHWLLSIAPSAVVMYFTMLACFQAFIYYAEARARESHAALLAEQLAEARLDALRGKLNPHFLFNSLNAITVLVRDKNTRAASRVLELLSDLLRQVLRPEQPNEVPLTQELEFVERYLAIEQVRFMDRLHVDFDIDSSTRNALVPTFLLQPLVENAIRHGVAGHEDAGRITVSARVDGSDLHLSVRDDGIGFDTRAKHDGIGLSNTRERLETLYADRAKLSIEPLPNRGTEVSIVMPYRHVES